MLRFGRHAAPRVALVPACGRERPALARPQRRGSPDPIPNSAVKPAFAESTAAPGCGRTGRRAHSGRFRISRVFGALFSFRGRGALSSFRAEARTGLRPVGCPRRFAGFAPPRLRCASVPLAPSPLPRSAKCSQRLTGSFSGYLANCGVFSWSEIVFRPFLVLWNWILFSLSENDRG